MNTAIIGIGNPLWGDDGLGVHLARNAHPGLPSEVDVIEAGTAGLDLLRFFEKYERVIFLDAVRHQGEPGDVIAFVPGETGDIAIRGSSSAHELDLGFVLQLCRSLRNHTEVLVVGCEPLRCGPGEGLSEPVIRAIPAIWEEVLRRLRAMRAERGVKSEA